MINVLIVAAGSSTRMGFCKITHKLGKATVLEKSLAPFLHLNNLRHIVVCVSKDNLEQVKTLLSGSKVHIVLGGHTRTESCFCGLQYLHTLLEKDANAQNDIVLIHDGARPYVSSEVIDSCITTTQEYGSGIAAVKVTDTIRIAENNASNSTLERDSLLAMQTPQGFVFSEIYSAYTKVDCSRSYYDDAQVYMLAYGKVHFSKGSYSNIKITTIEDIK